MSRGLVVFVVLGVGCGGVASPRSEAPSQPPSDETPCAVTDGSVEAAWGASTMNLTGACYGAPKLAFTEDSSVFQLCAQDASGLTLVLGNEPGGDYAQVYLDGSDMRIAWVKNSLPSFALTITELGSPGHYVEGYFSGSVQDQNTSTGATYGPATALSGSFKVCRAPDEPPPQ